MDNNDSSNRLTVLPQYAMALRFIDRDYWKKIDLPGNDYYQEKMVDPGAEKLITDIQTIINTTKEKKFPFLLGSGAKRMPSNIRNVNLGIGSITIFNHRVESDPNPATRLVSLTWNICSSLTELVKEIYLANPDCIELARKSGLDPKHDERCNSYLISKTEEILRTLK